MNPILSLQIIVKAEGSIVEHSVIRYSESESFFRRSWSGDEDLAASVSFESLDCRVTLHKAPLPMYSNGSKIRQLPSNPIDVISE